jgi:hypothetical protein
MEEEIYENQILTYEPKGRINLRNPLERRTNQLQKSVITTGQ